MGKLGRCLVTVPGKIATILVFLALFGVGISGMTQLIKNFKLEWFIPSDSYVTEFLNTNDQYFKQGTPFDIVMTSDVKYFESQRQLHQMSEYLESSALIDQGVGVTSWLGEFRTAITNGMANNDPDYDQTWLDEKGDFKDKDTYYRQLHRWYRDGGLRFQGSMQWKSKACENSTLDVWETTACDPTLGLRGARAQATIALEYSDQGYTRYESMTMLRQNISGFITETSKVVMEEDSCGNTDVMGDTPAVYPFSPQFLFWEEMGVIDVELTRNLLICGAVILVMIALMIPVPRIAIWVAICIIMSIIDVVGILHYWDIQVNGVTTIYILISVGLAVDYSAHIAHMFKESTGPSDVRAIKALQRIGPSVFNAVVSTFLAVCVMSGSKSYVFLVFFKSLFLVTIIAGSHGLVLLPVLLSIFGGNNGEDDEANKGVGNKADGICGGGVVVVPAAEKTVQQDEQGAGAGGPVVAVPIAASDVQV